MKLDFNSRLSARFCCNMQSSLLRYDYLKITNENSDIFGVICGVRRGSDIIVTGDYARLTFHSDAEVQGRGFFISFTVIPRPGKQNRTDNSQSRQGRVVIALIYIKKRLNAQLSSKGEQRRNFFAVSQN